MTQNENVLPTKALAFSTAFTRFPLSFFPSGHCIIGGDSKGHEFGLVEQTMT
jgi:hypothetical protein